MRHRKPKTGAALRGLAALSAAGSLAATWIAAGSATAGEYYTCRDTRGRIEIRDTPCPAGARTLSAEDVPEMSIPRESPAGSGEARSAPKRPSRLTIVPSLPASILPGAASRRGGPGGPSAVRNAPFEDPDWDPGLIQLTLLRARFSGVLASLHSLRNASMMHQAENGFWPTSAEDMRLDGSTMQSKEIADVHFLPDGTILAELKPLFGKDKFVAMQPVEELGGAQTGWKCRANFPEKVFGGMFASTCESRVIVPPAHRARR
ncbi:MAG: DUF4124 domain-containing protein [Deltaproteobacteria bacterium]|nr:DUF4124 domain-containing protein [Deltaproteobacteria bacterium]